MRTTGAVLGILQDCEVFGRPVGRTGTVGPLRNPARTIPQLWISTKDKRSRNRNMAVFLRIYPSNYHAVKNSYMPVRDTNITKFRGRWSSSMRGVKATAG
jgi:hypothetical protein